MKMTKRIIGFLSAVATAAACIGAAGVTASAAVAETTWTLSGLTASNYNTGDYTDIVGTNEIGGSLSLKLGADKTSGEALTDDVTTDGISLDKNQPTRLKYTAAADGTLTLTVNSAKAGVVASPNENRNSSDPVIIESSNTSTTATYSVTSGTTYYIQGSSSTARVVSAITFTPSASVTPATVTGEKLTADGKITGDDNTTADVWYYTVTSNDQTVKSVTVTVEDKTGTLDYSDFTGTGYFGLIIGYSADNADASYTPTAALTVAE